ncbi:MAG: hypothetical protein ABIH83_00705 [Candidatus Micrarchaeota archaeon]
MPREEKKPESLVSIAFGQGLEYSMAKGAVHISFKPKPLFVKLGSQKFRIEDEPAIIIRKRRIPVKGIF